MSLSYTGIHAVMTVLFLPRKVTFHFWSNVDSYNSWFYVRNHK